MIIKEQINGNQQTLKLLFNLKMYVLRNCFDLSFFNYYYHYLLFFWIVLCYIVLMKKKCSSNAYLLSNINPKWFCNDAWKTFLLLKRKGGWQTFFSFLEEITSWACSLRSGLKLIFHWKTTVLFWQETKIKESQIMENNDLRIEPWRTPSLKLVHGEDCPLNTTLLFPICRKII